MINVLIFAEGALAKLLSDVFSARREYHIVAVTHGLDQLAKAVSSQNKLIILCDITQDKRRLDALNPVVAGKNVRILAIASGVTQGFEALSKGAIEMAVVPTPLDPSSSATRSFTSIMTSKVNKIYKEYDVEERVLKKNLAFNKNSHKIVAIGSSTGGTEVMLDILKDLPADAPPVLVVQHMPAVFTKLYAKRLNGICQTTVWEAQDGDEVRPGLVLIAPGNKQMRLEQRGGKYIVTCRQEEKVGGHMPSVDVLFHSVAKEVGGHSIAVMLTGMGRDGAEGMLELKRKGAYTIGQDEKTSMVYGMPKAPYDIGAVQIQVPPTEMAKLIIKNK